MTTPDSSLQLPATSTNGHARREALYGGPLAFPDGNYVTYRSAGRLLVIGPEERALPAARRLRDILDVYALLTVPGQDALSWPDIDDFGARLRRGAPPSVSGHLGAFTARVWDGGRDADLPQVLGAGEVFDLVLDLGATPALRRQKNPPGYYAVGPDGDLDGALAELSDLIGDFDKPRYFAYEPDLCVHGNRGQRGCTRCLDQCATEAIRSAGERIEVDPFLCQGCGTCATVCPTGAITYAWPSPEHLIDHVRGILRRYRSAGGSDPVLLFHDAEGDAELVAGWAPDLPESVLPVGVEDTGSVGPDTWLAALAYGAGRVVLVMGAETPASERAATQTELATTQALIEALGYPQDRLALVDPAGDAMPLADAPPPLVDAPAGFAAFGGKRAVMRLALDHLWQAAGAPAVTSALPEGAPFGRIAVDGDACTLCMACVSVCPVQALEGGGDQPRLSFREDRCVQCGMCERACPEDAITLEPRIDPANLQAADGRVVHEEPLHHCPECGKAFATRKLIERMEQRLADHWMFAGEDARRRLRLCEDCRVQAVLRDEGSIDPYR